MMVTVAALLEWRPDQHELARTLAGVAEVRGVSALEPLLTLLKDRRADVVLLEVAERPAANLADAIRQIGATAPGIPIVVWFRPVPMSFRALPGALELGQRLECQVRGYDLLGSAITRVVEPDWEPGPAALLLSDVIPLIPWPLRTFFCACLVRPAPDLSMQSVMEWIGEKERTIRDRLRRLGPLTPALIRGYATALHAAWLLDRRHLRPGQVATALRLPNDRALRLNLKTYAQLTPDQIRVHGGFGQLRLHFAQVLSGRELPRGHASLVAQDPAASRPRPHLPDQVLPLAPIERERLLAAGIADGALAERVRKQPLIGSWSVVPVSLGDLGVLFDSACRAAERGSPGTAQVSRLVALRILRVMHGLAALPDPPLPLVAPAFLSPQEAARLFGGQS